jgi:protocatechuate 3,4-dioxygenase beta subunit
MTLLYRKQVQKCHGTTFDVADICVDIFNQNLATLKYTIMNRKDFLWKTGAAMLAFTLPVKRNYAFGPGGAHTTGDCVPTTTDILGPYYRANAPFRSNLIVPGDGGTILKYKGKVTDENCNPLAHAIVDVWQADSDAEYDGTSADFNYRGRFETGADGMYNFRSVKPGWYLNGAQYRPAHIHFRVTCAGYTELITQLYFEGDPYIAADPWASDPDAVQRIVPIQTAGGEDEATFNITLDGNGTHIKEQQQRSPVKIFPNPFKDVLTFDAGVSIMNIELFNTTGQLVAWQYDIKSQPVALSLGFLGSGIYFCRIETEKGIFVHRVVKE